MTRKLPNCPVRPGNVSAHLGFEHRELTVQVVTPMFGGGVEPGQPDPVTLIRPTAIRGHLRFWWRATRGAAFADTKALKQREVEIFGDTTHPSPLVVEVKIISAGTSKPCASLPSGKSFPKFTENHPAYALFPFQGNAKEGIPIGSGTNEVQFHLKVRFPENHAAEINAALWAWLNLGGIGSRTRRGCGALYCADMAPTEAKSTEELRKWFAAKFKEFGLSENPVVKAWPVLGPVLYIRHKTQNPMIAWNDVISVFRTFRQGENIGRNRGSGTPGRSRWPEPESIRRATQAREPRHARMDTIPDDVYPRAEFGLPIIFHFKDKRDPPDTQLVPASSGTTRMASPLILKPMAVSVDSAVSIIVPLSTEGVGEVAVEKVKPASRLETRPVRSRQLSGYPNSPLGPAKANSAPRSASGSAIEAFCQFACEHGFQPVTIEVKP